MDAKYFRAALPLAGIAAGVAIIAGTTLGAGPADHTGDPAVWGPPLEVLCNTPSDAAAAGYNVIEDPTAGVADGGLLEGTNAADAIFANGGDDIVYAGAGNDLICGGSGNDDIFGEAGNDAIFGQDHADKLEGGGNGDYLDGGPQIDECDGGNGDDAASALCNTVAESSAQGLVSFATRRIRGAGPWLST